MKREKNSFPAVRLRVFWLIIFALLLAGPLLPGPARAEDDLPPFRVLVFAPQFSHYSENNTYSYLFKAELEKQWAGHQVELRSFPHSILTAPSDISRTLAELADDPLLRGVVLGEAPVGSINGLARLRAKRPDIYVIVIDPHEKIERMAQVATLTLSLNHTARGFLYPTLAHRMGARTLVYFSFPRHLALPGFGQQYRVMSQVTLDLQMIMVSDIKGPDPLDPACDLSTLEEYLTRAVRAYLDQYGPDTAFVTTSTTHSDLLVPIVMREGGAMLPAVQPSLLLGYPEALDMVEETRALFGQWRKLLGVMDEKIMARASQTGLPDTQPPLGQFAAWTYPYPHTVMMAMTDLTVAAIAHQDDIYNRNNIDQALSRYSPGIKWQVSTQMDYLNDRLLPQALLLIQDTYWFGHGYQGFTQLNIPAKYYRIK